MNDIVWPDQTKFACSGPAMHVEAGPSEPVAGPLFGLSKTFKKMNYGILVQSAIHSCIYAHQNDSDSETIMAESAAMHVGIDGPRQPRSFHDLSQAVVR